jgi:hypothetical protein
MAFPYDPKTATTRVCPMVQSVAMKTAVLAQSRGIGLVPAADA